MTKDARSAYPHIVDLVDEANRLLPIPYFHLKSWVNMGVIYIQLEYGDKSGELQTLEYSPSQIQSAIQGFINGFNIGKQSVK